MVELVRSATFDCWLGGLRNTRASARLQVRLDRMPSGHPGDVKPVGEGMFDMRID